MSRLVYARRTPGVVRLAKEMLALYGMEVPAQVEVGPGLRILHRGFGTVIHPSTRIGSHVTIYHGVTIGRSDVWVARAQSRMQGVVIEDEVILCPGAKILCKEGVLTIGRGTIVGANAVLTRSTGADEVWAGIPARLLHHCVPPK
jgi:serine O-acetyltransferase